MPQKTWFITGTSRGFGREWAVAARDVASLDDVLARHADAVPPIALDVTDRAAGNPAASAQAVLRLVDAERPPLRVFFGDGPLGIATQDYESRLATWREWEPLSLLARGGAPAGQE